MTTSTEAQESNVTRGPDLTPPHATAAALALLASGPLYAEMVIPIRGQEKHATTEEAIPPRATATALARPVAEPPRAATATSTEVQEKNAKAVLTALHRRGATAADAHRNTTVAAHGLSARLGSARAGSRCPRAGASGCNSSRAWRAGRSPQMH